MLHPRNREWHSNVKLWFIDGNMRSLTYSRVCITILIWFDVAQNAMHIKRLLSFLEGSRDSRVVSRMFRTPAASGHGVEDHPMKSILRALRTQWLFTLWSHLSLYKKFPQETPKIHTLFVMLRSLKEMMLSSSDVWWTMYLMIAPPRHLSLLIQADLLLSTTIFPISCV